MAEAKGYIVEASIRVRYRLVAEDEASAMERAKGYFADDLTELSREAHDPENYRVLETVEGHDAVLDFATRTDEMELELFHEIEEEE